MVGLRKNSFLRNALSNTGLPRWLSGKESTCHCRRCKRHGFDPWIGKIPWRRKWQPTPVFLPGESQGQRNLEWYSPCGWKESDMTEHTCSSYIHDIKGTVPYTLYIQIFLYIAIGAAFWVLLRDFEKHVSTSHFVTSKCCHASQKSFTIWNHLACSLIQLHIVCFSEFPWLYHVDFYGKLELKS